MSNNNGVFLDLYVAWEAKLDPVTEEPFPSWVCVVHIAFNSSSESNVFSVPSCPRSFRKGDDDEREWMLEVMYESHRKFYSESVHVVYMVSL